MSEVIHDADPDVVSCALFGLVFWNDQRHFPAIRSIADPRMVELRDKAIAALEARNPKLHSPYFHDATGVWELNQETLVETNRAAYDKGVEAAKADIDAGRLQYRWHGHAGHWGHWIVSELEKRFGIGVNDGFGVCFVCESQISFDGGYNATLAADINRRHGDGAFEAVIQESRQQSEEALGDAKRVWLDRHAEA